MGLLAYKNPANSPLGHLVSGLQNQAIADKVNDAVLGKRILCRFMVPRSNGDECLRLSVTDDDRFLTLG